MAATALAERIFDSSDSEAFFSLLVSDFSGKDFTLDDLKSHEGIQEFVATSVKTLKPAAKKTSTKKLAKKPLSKDSVERALESPDENRCQARVWAKGFGGQCSKSFVDGGCFCKTHQADVDENGSWWLCKVTEPRPENPVLPTHPDRVHKWRITEDGSEIPKEKKVSVKKEQKEKKASVKKEQKEKKASVKELREKCAELGLDVKGKKAELIERIEAFEANPLDGWAAAGQPEEEKTPDETTEEPVVEDGAGVGLLEKDENEYESVSEDMDEITFEGVIYHMDKEKKVFDQYSNEMIGNWDVDSEEIEFLSEEYGEKHEEYKEDL